MSHLDQPNPSRADRALAKNLEVVRNLEPAAVWKNFAALSVIPRPSKEEGQVRAFIKDLADKAGLESATDNAGNMVVRIPGRGRGIGKPTVVLQSHMDMVCEADKNISHNFQVDPIQLRRDVRVTGVLEEEVICASGTTLGSDNGIGVSTALTFIGNPNIEDHPPLELLFTTDEEMGLGGAKGVDDQFVRGRLLINLDTEDGPTRIFISCAGGRDMTVRWPIERTAPTSEQVPLRFKISGFPGGHSGVNIHEARGNAILALVQALDTGMEGFDFNLGSLNGGNARNAIPRDAEAVIWVNNSDREEIVARLTSDQMIEATGAALEDQYRKFHMTIETLESDAAPEPIITQLGREILTGIEHIPNGVLNWSATVPNLVESSNNVGVIGTEADAVLVTCATRSSKNGEIDRIQEAAMESLNQSGAQVLFSDGYSGWEADLENPLLKQAISSFEPVLGQSPELVAIHAGLECGVLCGRLSGLRAISIGPIIRDAHSPRENIVIGSVAPFFECLNKLLQDLCTVEI